MLHVQHMQHACSAHAAHAVHAAGMQHVQHMQRACSTCCSDQRTYPYLVPPNPFPPPSSLPFSRPSLPSKLQEQQDEEEEDEMVVMESVNMAMQHMLQGANTPCPPGPHLLCSLSQPSLPSNQQGVDEEGGDEEDDEMVKGVPVSFPSFPHVLQVVADVVEVLAMQGGRRLACGGRRGGGAGHAGRQAAGVSNLGMEGALQLLSPFSFPYLPFVVPPYPHTSGGGRRGGGAGHAGRQARVSIPLFCFLSLFLPPLPAHRYMGMALSLLRGLLRAFSQPSLAPFLSSLHPPSRFPPHRYVARRKGAVLAT
ncbi:unnamed protein product [Closterium sp. NIES-53]